MESALLLTHHSGSVNAPKRVIVPWPDLLTTMGWRPKVDPYDLIPLPGFPLLWPPNSDEVDADHEAPQPPS